MAKHLTVLNKSVANGVASLNGSTVVPDAEISQGSVTQHQAALTLAESQVTNLTTDLAAKLALAGGTMTGALTLNADPTNALHAVTKQYADALKNGLDIKDSVRVATTASLPANTRTGNILTASANGALSAQDGITLVVNDRILVKDEATGANNGLYYVSAVGDVSNPFTLTRTTDADASIEVTGGMYVFVEEGTTNADSGWVLTNDGTITLNTTSLTFVQFSGAGQITAGNGMTKTGNTLDVVGTANRISVTADAVDISSSYVGQTSITTLGTIGTGAWQGTSIATTYTDAKIKTVTGTASRLTIGGTATDPTFDISTSYVGQATITTLGTIATGIWQGTAVADAYIATSYIKADGTRALTGNWVAGAFSATFNSVVVGDAANSVAGGAASGGNFTLKSTTHATKGGLLFGTSAYDEVNNRLGLATAAPNLTLDIVGGLANRDTTNAAITADQNDYAIGAGSSFRLSTDATRTITGLTGGVDGKVLIVMNVGSNSLVLANQSASSVAANRIITGTGANVTYAADEVAILKYDNTSTRWRVIV